MLITVERGAPIPRRPFRFPSPKVWCASRSAAILYGKDHHFGLILAQLSHQTKKYDLKSKHCGAQTDLGTTRAKVVEALTEVRRAKIDGPALIFDDQLCELHSSNTDASTSASSRSMPNVLGKDSDF